MPINVLFFKEKRNRINISNIFNSDIIKPSNGILVTKLNDINKIPIVSRKKFDCIILDLYSPDSIGLSILRMISFYMDKTPILVVATIKHRKNVLDVIHYGAEDYLVKGFISKRQLITSIYSSIEKRKSRSKLHNLSLVDEMTGLYNRRGFFELSLQQIKTAKRSNNLICSFFADVNYLKTVNDTFGHKSGDLLIKKTADILKKTFRDVDIVSRLGGDEFVVLTLQNKNFSYDSIKDRLQNNLDEVNNSRESQPEVSLSVGMASVVPANISNDNGVMNYLLAKSDEALYKSKENKNGRTLSFTTIEKLEPVVYSA